MKFKKIINEKNKRKPVVKPKTDLPNEAKPEGSDLPDEAKPAPGGSDLPDEAKPAPEGSDLPDEAIPGNKKKRYSDTGCPQTEQGLKEQDFIKYRCVSPLIGELQTKFGKHPILEAVLQKGTPKKSYDDLEAKYVDSKYGPRTELAFTAILKIFKNVVKDDFGKLLNYKQYLVLKSITDTEVTAKSFSMDDVETIVFPLRRIVSAEPRTIGGPGNIAAESVSYRKDLLKPTKNRHKQLEKLVFERLVKGCK